MNILSEVAKGVRNTYTGVKDLLAGKEPVKDNKTSDTETISKWEGKVETAMMGRAGWEKQCFINIAFVLGQQWLNWNDSAKKFEEPKAPKWRVRITLNKILPRYRKALTRLSSYDPSAVATPNSNETLDIDAAQLGTKVLKGLKDKVKMNRIKHRMNQWRLLCGTSFEYAGWNSGLGSEIPNEDEEHQRLNIENQETQNEFSALTNAEEPASPEATNKLFTGDIEVEAVNPFEIYPLDYPESMETCNELAWVRYVPVDWVKRKYPDKADEIKPESDSTMGGMYMRKIESLISNIGFSANVSSREEDKVLYKRIFVRPTMDKPKGQYIVYVNGVLLENGGMPNIELGKEFEMPIWKYDDLEVPGRFWGQATIEQMIPLNKAKNKNISHIIESENLMGKPKWTAVKGTTNANAITSEPGEVIEWDATVPGAQEPKMVTPPALPAYVTLHLPAILDRAMGDVGAMHEAESGTVVPGVTSGTAIKELKKSDEDELNPLFIQDNENKKELYQALLKMVQDKYTEQRMLKVVGIDKAMEVISFMGADLRNNTDVWIETTDMWPTSRQGRQELVFDFFNKGLLGKQDNDETRKRALRMMEYGNIDDLWEASSLDCKQARFENKEMSKGNPQTVEWYDVHVAHMLEHLKPMKSPLFKQQSPLVQKLYIDHIKTHDDFISGVHPNNPNAVLGQEQPMGQEQLPMPQPTPQGV